MSKSAQHIGPPDEEWSRRWELAIQSFEWWKQAREGSVNQLINLVGMPFIDPGTVRHFLKRDPRYSPKPGREACVRILSAIERHCADNDYLPALVGVSEKAVEPVYGLADSLYNHILKWNHAFRRMKSPYVLVQIDPLVAAALDSEVSRRTGNCLNTIVTITWALFHLAKDALPAADLERIKKFLVALHGAGELNKDKYCRAEARPLLPGRLTVFSYTGWGLLGRLLNDNELLNVSLHELCGRNGVQQSQEIDDGFYMDLAKLLELLEQDRHPQIAKWSQMALHSATKSPGISLPVFKAQAKEITPLTWTRWNEQSPAFFQTI